MNTTLIQYCQKLVVFNDARDAILLAKRRGEKDFDGIFSLIGGKMEITDGDIISGIRREKIEEIGTSACVLVYPQISWNVSYVKNDGQAMILPHYFAVYRGGEIKLNPEEYSEYAWVALEALANFEPKIASIPEAVEATLKIASIIDEADLVEI
jgi:NADH pyrophosphatase NudC (nudix superfamily)